MQTRVLSRKDDQKKNSLRSSCIPSTVIFQLYKRISIAVYSIFTLVNYAATAIDIATTNVIF